MGRNPRDWATRIVRVAYMAQRLLGVAWPSAARNAARGQPTSPPTWHATPALARRRHAERTVWHGRGPSMDHGTPCGKVAALETDQGGVATVARELTDAATAR
jgi:hypothetical protein